MSMDFVTAVQQEAFYYLPALERLSKSSEDFTSDQQWQFITLFATGLIGCIGGFISCCRSPGNFNSSVKSMTVSLLGAITIATSYTLLASSCLPIYILSSNGQFI